MENTSDDEETEDSNFPIKETRIRIIIRKARLRWMYIIAFVIFMIFLGWLINPSIIIPLITHESANLVLNYYTKLILFWLSGLVALFAYFNTLIPSSKITPKLSKKPFTIDENYLLLRSDNLDRVTNYLRSWISLIAAVFTAIIAWILNMSAGRELTSNENTLITICSILVFFSVISVMVIIPASFLI